jgi:hypothetical protein
MDVLKQEADADRIERWRREVCLLRKQIRQPITDTVIVPKGKTTEKDCFFVDHKRFKDGTPKTIADTTMTCDGMLGWPLALVLEEIGIHFAKFTYPEDLKTVFETMSFRFIFGSNVPYWRFAAADLVPNIDYVIDASAACCEKGTECWINAQSILERKIREYMGDGIWRWYKQDAKVDYHGRLIESTESFRLEAEIERPIELKAPVWIKAILRGRLLVQL